MALQPTTARPALAPAVVTPSSMSNTVQAVVFICVSIAIFIACCLCLCCVMWYCWRRSRREYEMRRLQQQLADQMAQEEGSVKKQVRLPIVVINPDDDMEYGRKESIFFSAGLKPVRKEGKLEGGLPNTPPAGTYYIEGAPGFFEVDVVVGSGLQNHTPATTPRSSSKTGQFPFEMLSAAVGMLSPRGSKSPEAEPASTGPAEADRPV